MPPETYTPGQQAVVGAILAIVGLGLVPVAVAAARHFYPQRVVFFARWGFSHVLLIFLAYLIVFYASGRLLMSADSGVVDSLQWMLVPSTVAAFAIVLIAHKRHPNPREALGFAAGGNLRAVVSGLSVFFLLLPGLFGVGLLWPWLFTQLGGVFQPHPLLAGFLELEGSQLVWACALAVVIVPFFEELLFRGFLQPLLCQNFGEQGGIVLTSAFFGGLHGQSFLPVFALSWMLGAVMVRTHRLVGPWAMHAAFNGLNLALLLAVPGGRDLLN